jgi:hypothetical protein
MEQGFLSTAGSIASSLLAIFAVLGVFASKTSKGKEWVKGALGIVELTEKLNIHLEGDKITQTKLEYYQNQIFLQNEALVASLRKDLKYMCNDALERQWITINELEMITKAYDIYKKLNGNSFIAGLVKKVGYLEIKEDKF